MSFKMGRMTKRNRAKYRRRAYEAGMRGNLSVLGAMPPRVDRSIGGMPGGADGKRAA